jgi:hypothetical protein
VSQHKQVVRTNKMGDDISTSEGSTPAGTVNTWL